MKKLLFSLSFLILFISLSYASQKITGDLTITNLSGSGTNCVHADSTGKLGIVSGDCSSGSGNITIGTTSPLTGAGTGNLFTLGLDENKITLSNLGGNVTDSQVPNNITVDLATTVTTNANLTGDITSIGNTTTLGSSFKGWVDGGSNIYQATTTDNVGIGTSIPNALFAVGSTSQFKVSSSGVITGTATNITGLPEAGLTLVDNTTNDSSTSKHGFLKKLNNIATNFMNGQGNWSAETDPKIGTLTNTKYCTTDGSQVICTTDAPAGSGTVNSGAADYVAIYDTAGTTVSASSILSDNGTNIGIGTTGPREKLEVAGNIKANNLSGINTGDQTNITGNAGTVTFSDAGADTTTWIALGNAQTGNQAIATDAGLTYNSNTDALTATTFIGALTGNVTGNVTGTSGSTTGNAATVTGFSPTSGKVLSVQKTLTLTAADDTGVYTLPTGTKTLLATDGSAASLTNFPTLNQNTSGSAATLTTPRSIYGNNFDGSAALTQVIASTYGGTGNGFTKFTGPTTAEKTFTLPNSSETLLYAGGALGTPSSGVATNLTGTAAGLTAGTVTTNANLTGVITSVGNATSIASKTGTGTKFVVDDTPTLITPVLGVASATSINKVAITAPATSATLTIADGKTLTATNTVNLNTMSDGKICKYTASGTLIDCNLSCTDITGSASLCDGSDASGGAASAGGGNANIQWNNNTVIDGGLLTGIDSNGNVGIGTVSPSTTLEIVEVSSRAPLMVSGTPTGDGDIFMINSNGSVGIGTTLVSNTTGLAIMNGNVGIGTWSPRGALEILGTGNVGIGTFDPQTTLEVIGTSGSINKDRIITQGTAISTANSMDTINQYSF